MVKITLKIDGMSCGMCEAHINDTVRAAFRIKKVDSSHKKGTTFWIIAASLTRKRAFHCLKSNWTFRSNP